MVSMLTPLQSVAPGATTVSLVQLLTISPREVINGTGDCPSTRVTVKVQGADIKLFGKLSVAFNVTVKVLPGTTGTTFDTNVPGAGDWLTVRLAGQLSEIEAGG